MEKIRLPGHNRAIQQSELFHECTKYTPYNVARYSKDIARYLSDPIAIYSASRNLKTYNNSSKIPLEKVDLKTVSLGRVLANRQSCRRFLDSKITLSELAQMLYQSVGEQRKIRDSATNTEVSARAYPSAGALYPVETYVLLRSVTGVSPCLAHYSAQRHELSIVSESLDDDYISKAFMLQGAGFRNCPAIILFTALVQRSSDKYGDRGYRFALLEAGHAAQNVSLAAAAQGLGSIAWGSFYDDHVDKILGVDGFSESVVHGLLVGKPDCPPVGADDYTEIYNVGDILGNELSRAKQGVYSPADSLVAALAPKSTLVESLARLANHHDREVYWYDALIVLVGRQESVEQVRSILDEARFDEGLLGCLRQNATRTMLVELLDSSDACYTSYQCEGIRHLVISRNCPARVLHEITHGLCLSGHRYLDEGLALLVQFLYAGRESLLDVCDESVLSDSELDLQLVQQDLVESVGGGQILGDADPALYARAFRLVAELHRCLGNDDKLVEFYAQARGLAEPYEYVNAVLEVIAMSESVRSESHLDDQPETPLEVEVAIAKARKTREIDESYGVLLEQYLDSNEVSDQYLALRLLATSIRVGTLNGAHYKGEHDDTLNTLLEVLEPLSAPLVSFAKAQVIISRLFSLDGMNARKAAMEYAECLASATNVPAPHPSVLIDSALAEYYNESKNENPNFDKSRSKLELASQDSLYGEEAKKYLTNLKF